MKKLPALLALAAFVFAFAPAASASAQDDNHGKHKGWYKHGDDDDDDGYRHDNGKHKGWYKHHDLGEYDDWDYDGERIRPGYYYPRGRYRYIRHVIVVRGFDPRTWYIILFDQFNWVVASLVVPRCRVLVWARELYIVFAYSSSRG